jgi:tetratricopeptide (TPR) repeat protein
MRVLEQHQHRLGGGARRKHPMQRGPHFMLGICLVELGCIEAALPHYEAALRLGAADADVWMTHARIGEAQLLLGHDEEAISWFRQASAANPDNSAINRSRINLGLASAHALLGRLDEARLQVAEANRIWPFHTRPHPRR